MPLIRRVFIKRVCRFCSDKVEHIDYKDLERIGRYVTDRGKIMGQARNGLCAKHQKRLTAAIKHARHLALLPFTGRY